MKRIVLLPRNVQLALAAFGVLSAAVPVAAQETREITVVAPEAVRHTEGRTSSGGVIEVVSITHRVSYADLDLAKSADAALLEKRVSDAAKLGCKQLQDLYPLVPADPDCLKKAEGGGMEQAKAAVAAAAR